jgi:hypothetical protein
LLEGNYKQNIVYTYSTEHLVHKDKVLFFYAIKGRNGKAGLLHRLSVKQLGRCVLLAPVEAEKELDGFFQKWNCAFTKQSVMVAS